MATKEWCEIIKVEPSHILYVRTDDGNEDYAPADTSPLYSLERP